MENISATLPIEDFKYLKEALDVYLERNVWAKDDMRRKDALSNIGFDDIKSVLRDINGRKITDKYHLEEERDGFHKQLESSLEEANEYFSVQEQLLNKQEKLLQEQKESGGLTGDELIQSEKDLEKRTQKLNSEKEKSQQTLSELQQNFTKKQSEVLDITSDINRIGYQNKKIIKELELLLKDEGIDLDSKSFLSREIKLSLEPEIVAEVEKQDKNITKEKGKEYKTTNIDHIMKNTIPLTEEDIKKLKKIFPDLPKNGFSQEEFNLFVEQWEREWNSKINNLSEEHTQNKETQRLILEAEEAKLDATTKKQTENIASIKKRLEREISDAKKGYGRDDDALRRLETSLTKATNEHAKHLEKVDTNAQGMQKLENKQAIEMEHYKSKKAREEDLIDKINKGFGKLNLKKDHDPISLRAVQEPEVVAVAQENTNTNSIVQEEIEANTQTGGLTEDFLSELKQRLEDGRITKEDLQEVAAKTEKVEVKEEQQQPKGEQTATLTEEEQKIKDIKEEILNMESRIKEGHEVDYNSFSEKNSELKGLLQQGEGQLQQEPELKLVNSTKLENGNWIHEYELPGAEKENTEGKTSKLSIVSNEDGGAIEVKSENLPEGLKVYVKAEGGSTIVVENNKVFGLQQEEVIEPSISYAKLEKSRELVGVGSQSTNYR